MLYWRPSHLISQKACSQIDNEDEVDNQIEDEVDNQIEVEGDNQETGQKPSLQPSTEAGRWGGGENSTFSVDIKRQD